MRVLLRKMLMNPQVLSPRRKLTPKDYWFTKDGVMLSKFYLINDAMYYFGGSDGVSMKTGSQSIKGQYW